MSMEENKRGQNEAEAPQDENFAAMLKSSEMAGSSEALNPGDKVRGSVIHISGEDAFVSLGGKAEGVISVSELRSPQGELTTKVGDPLEAYVVSTSGGEIRLSRTAQVAKGADKRGALEDAYKSRLPVEGTVTSRNKGGFDVQILGMRAFCPVSQIESGYAENLDQYIGKSYRFRITEFKEGGRSIVVSRAALLREESASKGEQTLKALKPGDIFEGEVKSVRDFGAFVDIGGVEGLVHVSELSWGRVNHPKEVVSPGQKVKVKVIKIEDQPGKKTPRIGLTMRGLEASPWDKVGVEFREGETYDGTVVRLANFGAFVELSPGLDGLVHVSEMAWGRRINHPQEVVSVGQKVRVTVQGIDRDNKRISLSMKSTAEDPWLTVSERYAAGQQVVGRVEKVAPFGVFVSLGDGITALLPNSESGVRDPAREFPAGSELSAQILEIDPARRRLTLSCKALAQSAEAGNFDMFRAERSEKNEGQRSRRERDRERGERGDRGSARERDEPFDDGGDDDGDSGFGSLGDLIRSKGPKKRR
jgi:small subunit ribosomal protein S1